MINKIMSLVNQVLASGFSFLIIVAASRLLSADDFGVITLIIMIAVLIAVIPQSFVLMPIMSNSFKEKNIESYFFHNGILLIAILLISSLIFFIFYINNYFSIQYFFGFFNVVVYFVSQQLYEFFKRIMFVKNLHRHITLYEVLKILTSLSLVFLLVNESFTISIDTMLLAVTAGYLLFILFTVKHIKLVTINIDYFNLVKRKNYNFGKWIFISNTVQNINSNFYVYIAALLLPLNIIGALNAVRSLIGFSTVLFLALDNYLTPKYALFLSENNKEKLEETVMRTFNKIGLLLIGGSIMAVLFADEILSLIYGDEFAKYGYYLYFFLVANVFMFYTRPILILAKTIGVTKILFLASLPTLLFTLITTFSAIDLFKVNGALSIMCISQVIHLASLIYFYRKKSMILKSII